MQELHLPECITCNDAVLNYKFLLPKFRFQVFFFFFLAQIHTYDLKGNNFFTSEL